MKTLTFEDFKNQVAVKRGYESFFVFAFQSNTAHEELVSLIEEAHTFFVESERNRVWKEACEAQLESIRTGFEANIDKIENPSHKLVFRGIAATINKYPLAPNPESQSKEQ